MNRRTFMTTTVTTTAAAVAGLAVSGVAAGKPQDANATDAQAGPFKLKYAPHFGMFQDSAGGDPIDQLQFAHDHGFRAWEDNGMMGRSVQDQERIASAMSDLGIEMGVFVASAEWSDPKYVRASDDDLTFLRDQSTKAVECAKRVNAKWCTVVPGPFVNNMEWDYQTANVIKSLRAMAEIFEPAEVVMVLEPLNHWANHPGMFLSKIPQAKLICDAVNSPSCKILDDLYHQQIQEGNLIPNMDKAWDQIAYIQVGDNPGRNEPTTGEINYKNVFRHLKRKGFDGIVGMEHGVSGGGKEGEQRLIAAYRECDSFEV